MKVMVIEIQYYQLNNILTKLEVIINELKKSDTWKIQITIAINFISSKDNDQDYL